MTRDSYNSEGNTNNDIMNNRQSKYPESNSMKSQLETTASEPDWNSDMFASLTAGEIYHFYVSVMMPAFLSSIPILASRILEDMQHLAANIFQHILPAWSTRNIILPQLPGSFSLSESFMEHFDTNHDGHISAEELFSVQELLLEIQRHRPNPSLWHGFVREWPLLDWKIGVFLWNSCGSILLTLAILSIIPGVFHGWSARLLRWPVLGLTYCMVYVELVVYSVIRLIIRCGEFCIQTPNSRRLRALMAQSQSYHEWYEYANVLDKAQRRDRWLTRTNDDQTMRRYNWKFIRELIKDLQKVREMGDMVRGLAVLQQCTRLNVGGVLSEDLFSYSNCGEPKQIVNEFFQQVEETLHWITKATLSLKNDHKKGFGEDMGESFEYRRSLQKERQRMYRKSVLTSDLSSSSSEVSFDDESKTGDSSPPPNFHSTVPSKEVFKFLNRLRTAYGRTAFCMSGGAMMGCYHFGTIRALMELNLLPKIISGTSAGSVIGALVCTRTDKELEELLTPSEVSKRMTCFDRPWKDRVLSLFQSGYMFDYDVWMEKVKWFSNDITFEEAYKKTGRIFNIALSSTSNKSPPVLVNYLSAPNVTIASAVLASAAVPGCIKPVKLEYRDAHGNIKEVGDSDEAYFDGSIRQDIPVNGLAEMFNCHYFVASQCNPHIVPFFYNPKGGVGRPSRWSSGTQEHSWRGGFLLAALEMYLKNDMKAKLNFLKEVEAAVGFTSTLLTQEFVGSTTIVPRVSLQDYFKLLVDPSEVDLHRYFQGGKVAAYEHAALIKTHRTIPRALNDCISHLEETSGQETPSSSWKASIETLVMDAMRISKNGAIAFGNIKTTKEQDDFVSIDRTDS